MRIANLIITSILVLIVLAGCNGDEIEDSKDGDVPIPEISDVPVISRTITIGNITDITGPGAAGMELVNLALKDIVKYYNENNLIPGVEFEVLEWDGQMNPDRTIPGYERLKQQEVDILTTCAPGVAVTLKPLVDTDKIVLFAQMDEMAAIEPPGYVFSLACLPEHEAYTLMSWIAEKDWDYEKNGPAKLGAAAWRESYATSFIRAMKDYANVHPDKFEFVVGHLPDLKFDWSNEIQSLKDCDYVFTPLIMQGFADDMRDAGSKARFVGGTPHTALLKQVDNAGAWPTIDGMLFIFTGVWHGETGEDIDFVNMMLNRYHPEEKEDIISNGASYIAILTYRTMMQIVEKTIETTGPKDFNLDSLYETAQSWNSSISVSSRVYNYTSTKRYLLNDLGILEASAQQKNLVRNDPDWYPILTQP